MVNQALAYSTSSIDCARKTELPDRRLQRQRRIRDGEGGRHERGWIDERADRARKRLLLASSGPGADLILTYQRL